MNRTLLSGIVALLMVSIPTGSYPAPQEPERLVFWGLEKIFLGEVRERWFVGPTVRLTELTTDQPVHNIIDVNVVGQKMTVVGAERPLSPASFRIFVVNPVSGRVEARIPERGQTAAPAPDGHQVAFTAFSGSPEIRKRRECSNPEVCWDVRIWDLGTSGVSVIAKATAHRATALSWRPAANELVFDATDGWIYSVELKRHRTVRLIKGTSPSWAPDGKRIAFRRGDILFLYDTATSTETKVYEHHVRRSELVGPGFWSPDGRYIAMNAGTSGRVGEYSRCTLVDVNSGKAREVHKDFLAETFYQCGPWVARSFGSK
jgi:hypothetical protein